MADNQVDSLQGQLELLESKIWWCRSYDYWKLWTSVQRCNRSNWCFLRCISRKECQDLDAFALGLDKFITFVGFLNPALRKTPSVVEALADAQEEYNNQMRIQVYKEYADGLREANIQQIDPREKLT